MNIKVTHDGEAVGETRELCCICYTPTNFWHASDVAVCLDCAKTTKARDLPTKAAWCSDPRQPKANPWRPA